jgi:hypothetical protein
LAGLDNGMVIAIVASYPPRRAELIGLRRNQPRCAPALRRDGQPGATAVDRVI